jgi:hypothetical protein
MLYCSYLTTYSGDKLPRWYIGSTSVEKIEQGYHGSIKSKKYKAIYYQELRDHPELFKTDIIKVFETRREATQNEYELQVACDVVKSKDYFNMSFAAPNGFFGMSAFMEGSPRFGKKHTEEACKKNSECAKKHFENPEEKKKALVRTKKYFDNGTLEEKEKRIELKCKKVYIITNPCGNEETISNLSQFCRDYGLDHGNMSKVLRGEVKHQKGYLVRYQDEPRREEYWNYEEYLKGSSERNSEVKCKNLYIVTFPDSHEQEVRSITQFCKDHNLNNGHMYQVLKGKVNHHKGYRVRIKETNE